MKWVTFFSQTGSEINNLRKELNRDPDLIITNRQDMQGVNSELLSNCPITIIPDRPSIENYKKALHSINALPDNCIITLHGYLRIVPKFICDQYQIFNLHPGLITKYPILKGFNPQEKAYKLGLPTTGVVIHKVVEKVDSGEILKSMECDIKNQSLDDIYIKLHNIATQLWVNFLKEELK